MKCEKCNGTGYCDLYMENECPVCHGSGVVEQTNEEWARSATFDELAGVIYEWYSLGYTRGKNGIKLNSITEVVEWLNGKHREG